MYRNLLEIPFQTAERYPNRVSHAFKVGTKTESRTFAEFTRLIRLLAAGFEGAGVVAGDHVGFFVNNRYEWIATDFALMALGAVTVPRGSDTAPKEVSFIFRHSESSVLILETASQLVELVKAFEPSDWVHCRSIFIIEGGEDPSAEIPEDIRRRIMPYSALTDLGEKRLAEGADPVARGMERLESGDLLTIVYTSGTTGNPKGVMLTQGNFLQNVTANTPRLEIDPEREETTVVMLPAWHVYERAFEYCCLSTGIRLVYSHAGRFAADLAAERPHLLISVPRVWESIHQKLVKAISEMSPPKRRLVLTLIKANQIWLTSTQYLRGHYISLRIRNPLKKMADALVHLFRAVSLAPIHLLANRLFTPFREKVGGRLRLATCGAGSLPKYLDELFNAIGITLVNAYGMTECAPGILSRTLSGNTFGSTGIPFDNTEVEVRREDGTVCDVGEKGIVFARGPQVMKGYYKNPEATAAVLSPDGWLNTGDLAVRSENGEFIIVGRMKDTIVLMGGENVEPEALEDKLKESVYIDHAVVIGQDQKQLSAIVAVNEEELMRLASELKLSPSEVVTEGKYSIENDVIYQILQREVNKLISREHGFKPFEYIAKILPVRSDFSIGKELTQTLKVKRKYVEERYRALIERLFGDGGKK